MWESHSDFQGRWERRETAEQFSGVSTVPDQNVYPTKAACTTAAMGNGHKPTTGAWLSMCQAWRHAPLCGGGMRWSAQSCGPRRQSWRRMAFASAIQVAWVLLCRRGRRHAPRGWRLGGTEGCGSRAPRPARIPAAGLEACTPKAARPKNAASDKNVSATSDACSTVKGGKGS